MPDIRLEWSAPQALIDSLSSGGQVEEAIGLTKSSFAQFLTHTGVAPAQAAEAADMLVGRIVTALSKGESPENAVAWAKEGLGQVLDQLAESKTDHPQQDLAQALAQGGADAAAVARAVADAGGSPEAQKAAVEALQTALSNGSDPAAAHQQAIDAGHTAAGLQAGSALAMGVADALVSKLSQGGQAAGDAVHALTAGMGPEQSAALTQSLLSALADGSSSEAALHAGQEGAASQAQTAQAQSVPVSSADALVAALASGANVDGALAAAGLGGNSPAGQALALALGGGADSGAAQAAGQDAEQAQADATALSTAGVAEPSALLAGLASGGQDAASALATASQGQGDGDAFSAALSQALEGGATTEAAIQDASAAATAAEAQGSEASVPATAESALATALASGADVSEALAAAGMTGDGSGAAAMVTALTEALTSGHDVASAMGAAETAGSAAEQQVAAAQEGVPPVDPQLAALASGGQQDASGSTSGSESGSGTQTAAGGSAQSASGPGSSEAAAATAGTGSEGGENATPSGQTGTNETPPGGQNEAPLTPLATLLGSNQEPPAANAPPTGPDQVALTGPASTASADAGTSGNPNGPDTQTDTTITVPFSPENHAGSSGPETTTPAGTPGGSEPTTTTTTETSGSAPSSGSGSPPPPPPEPGPSSSTTLVSDNFATDSELGNDFLPMGHASFVQGTGVELINGSNNAAGYLINNTEFSIGTGVTINFTYSMSGVADGMSLFLLNTNGVSANSLFTTLHTEYVAGATGGYLGYAGLGLASNAGDTNGPIYSNGAVAVGMDEYSGGGVFSKQASTPGGTATGKPGIGVMTSSDADTSNPSAYEYGYGSAANPVSDSGGVNDVYSDTPAGAASLLAGTDKDMSITITPDSGLGTDYYNLSFSLTSSGVTEMQGSVVVESANLDGSLVFGFGAGTGSSTGVFTVNSVSVTQTGDPPLAPVAADSTNPAGETISSLFSESGSSQVTILDNYATSNQGAWQYSTDDSTSWTTLNGGAISTPVTLSSDDSLRFVPTEGWSGTPGDLLVLPAASSGSGGSQPSPELVSTEVTPVSGGGAGGAMTSASASTDSAAGPGHHDQNPAPATEATSSPSSYQAMVLGHSATTSASPANPDGIATGNAAWSNPGDGNAATQGHHDQNLEGFPIPRTTNTMAAPSGMRGVSGNPD